MTAKKPPSNPEFGQIKNSHELGALIRAFRKSQHLTLEKVAGLTNISMRFLSELERGKETAQLGKALATINNLGLDIIIQPRAYSQQWPRRDQQNKIITDK